MEYFDKPKTVSVGETSEVKYSWEHIYNRDQYGKSAKLKGTDAYIFKILAFILTPSSGLLDYNMESWYIKEKVGLLDDGTKVNNEIEKLKLCLSKLKIPISAVDYTYDEKTKKVNLVFVFSTTAYVVDPIIDGLGDFSNIVKKINLK